MSDDYQYDYKAINDAASFSIAIGAISILFPLSVVFILTYQYKKLVSGKPFMHYIMSIAISDAVVSLSISFGIPSNHALCYSQGFLFNLAGRASWFYTDVLILQLFSVIVYKKHFLTVYHMNYIIWGLNIFLQVIPYTTGASYGHSIGAQNGNAVIRCVITHNEDVKNAFLWDNLTMNYEIIGSFIIIAVVTLSIVGYSIYIVRYDPLNIVAIHHINETRKTTILYPLSMLVAYVPSIIFASFVFNKTIEKTGSPGYHSVVILDYLFACNALYGVFLSLILYYKSPSARKEWMNLLSLSGSINNEFELETSTTSDSIINPVRIIDDDYYGQSIA